MEKTNPLRLKIFGLLCTLLFCLGSLPSLGQDCPSFQWSDFTKTMVQPNADCNTPGSVSIRYKNNIVGVDEVKYQFGSGASGPWFAEVDAPAPGATVTTDVPASMNGRSIYVRITTKCGANTRTDWWTMGYMSPQKAENIRLRVSSTPAGSGAGASGGVQAWLEGPTGFAEATFKLYKSSDRNTPIYTLRSTRPYEGVTFFNLPIGDYVVKAEAKPACTPTTTASSWETDHFALFSDVKVQPFNLVLTTWGAFGTCNGRVLVEASKVNGVQEIEYTLAKQSQPDTPIETKKATYPYFTRQFALAETGSYILKATEKPGNSSVSYNFNIYQESESDVSIEELHGTLRNTETGAARLIINPRPPCTATIKLIINKGWPDERVITRWTDDRETIIENLPADSYDVEVEYGGVVKKTSLYIHNESLGTFYSLTSKSAAKLCEPSGEASWKLGSGVYHMPRKVRITRRPSGQLVREFILPADERIVEAKNLFAGDYTVTVSEEESGESVTHDFTIYSNVTLEGYLSFDYSNKKISTDFCGEKPMMRIPVKYDRTGGIENSPQLAAFLNGATFEIYDKDNKFLYSGAMPALTGNATSYIETPYLENGYKLVVKSSCGFPSQNYSMSASAYKFSPEFTYRGCGNRGTNVDLRVIDTQGEVVPRLNYTLKKKSGELIGTYEMKEGVNTAIFANLDPGDYEVEWYPQCYPSQKHKETFTVEDKVKEISRSIEGSVCEDLGSIRINFTRFSNINGWRYELIRKSDNKMIRVYGSSSGGSLTFQRVPAGDYIVNAIPIVECGEITPGKFEVTVPLLNNGVVGQRDIELWQRDAKALPYQYVGKARYYANTPFSYVKWRVLDVVTNAEIAKGEKRLEPTNTYRYSIPIQGLPHTYKIEFETPCGTITRIDSLELDNRKNLPGFDLETVAGSTVCNTKPSLTVKSHLKEAGLPDKASRIQLYKFEDKGDGGGRKWYLDQEEFNPTAIIETKKFENLDPNVDYYVNYYYDGTSNKKEVRIPYNTGDLSMNTNLSRFSPKGTAILTITPYPADAGATMKVVVTNNLGAEIYNNTVPVDVPVKIELKKPATRFTANITVLSGCFKDKTFNLTFMPSSTPNFTFNAVGNRMKCKNDGEIKVSVPEEFYDVDQVSYTLKKTSGTQYTDVAETTKPWEPKSFIGLEAGTYEISARATVFKDENGQPKVMDSKQTVRLTTPYGDGLYATVRPDYMVSTRNECPNGRIGLNIEKGSGKYRVFLKKTPDGVLAKPQELFTDAVNTSMYNKLWGENLKPGHYALTVTDGCMERDIPDAEILEMPNLGKASFYAWYMWPDKRMKNELKDKVDSFTYSLRFDPSAFPASYQPSAYLSYEVQIVAKGAAPDNSQWKSEWGSPNGGYPTIETRSKRFNNCNGIDILLRLKNCPTSLIRIPSEHQVLNMFAGSWQLLKCNRAQWIFTDGEIGHKYRLKVRNTTDNVDVYDKEVTYNSREDFLKADPELNFPANKSYRLEMTPTDYCGNPLYSSQLSFERVTNTYRHSLDDGRILTDCDGRFLAIKGWTECELPMKYFVYEVAGGKETLVDQSGNYVPGIWYSRYKFIKDHRYIIRIVEYGEPETKKVDLVTFTLNYRFPKTYKKETNYLWSTQTMCGTAYNATKKGYDLNQLQSYYGIADWTGVPPVDQDTYLTIPKMQFVATQKAAPHRKFVTSQVLRYTDNWKTAIYTKEWKELLPDGTLLDVAYAPEGEYSMVAKTEGCGEFPLEDEYLGRPIVDLSPSTISSSCDGKFTITPKGTLTYRGSTETAEISSFYIKGENANTTRTWGQTFDTYQREFTLVLNIKRKSDGKVCTVNWPFSASSAVLDFDQSQSLSLFCSDSGKGIIHMALKGGQAPYTYKLMSLDGTEIARKTVPGAVDFEHGKLGERYRITATDACGLTWIHQDVLLQDPAAISSSMDADEQFCEGDHAKLTARSFPNVTYEWHLPDGSVKQGQELDFIATKAKAGLYTVDIHLTSCTVTLTGRYTVGIVSIKEADGLVLNQQACAGEPVQFNLNPASAILDGENADDYITYQWEQTVTPNDEETWTPIRNATQQNLTYNAVAPGVYYVRRTAMIGECKAISGQSKLTVVAGINVTMTPDEQFRTINDKNPFTLTAGIVTGNPNRTYQWQRSIDKKTWVNIGTDETFTETKRWANTVYYRRIVSAGACSIEGQPITVRFKKRWPAYINPQVRQRTLDD